MVRNVCSFPSEQRRLHGDSAVEPLNGEKVKKPRVGWCLVDHGLVYAHWRPSEGLTPTFQRCQNRTCESKYFEHSSPPLDSHLLLRSPRNYGKNMLQWFCTRYNLTARNIRPWLENNGKGINLKTLSPFCIHVLTHMSLQVQHTVFAFVRDILTSSCLLIGEQKYIWIDFSFTRLISLLKC